MAIEQLGHGAAELLSLTNGGEARSLNKLTELAAWQVPSCSGAHAAVWRDGEVASAAATHPDLAELADLQLRSGSGPLVEAAESGAAVTCPDTLDEARWPEFAEAALRRGVRCSVHLVRELHDTGYEPAFDLMNISDRPLLASIHFRPPAQPQDQQLFALADRCFAASYFRKMGLA